MSKTTDYANTPSRTMPHMWSVAQQREQRMMMLQQENAALIKWAKEAYTRLQSLMTIGVSMTPDAVTAKLLQDAPEAVKGGDK